MERKEFSTISGAISALHKALRAEIHEERDRHRHLYASGTPGRITLVILGAAILGNILFFLVNPVYPLLFISASFFLFMFYFITLLIPHNLKRSSFPDTEFSKYLTGLQETGVIRSTKRFTRIFLNAFFINCRTLFYGFALIFTIDIILVIAMHLNGKLSSPHTGIILFQSVAIIIFYFLVWKLEPYSTDFFSDVSGMRAHLIRKNIPEPVVSFLFLLGAALALVCIISTIILLPGITVNNVLSVSEFSELGHFFVSIGIVLVSLYFIFRYLHGITSRDLLIRFSKTKTDCLLHEIEITGDAIGSSGASGSQGLAAPDTVCKAAELLLEARLYQVEKKTVFGTFPVYIVNPDFSQVFPRSSSGDTDPSRQ
ncbi:MAG: hypothetical protein ACLQMU_11505 [Methanoregula sp.]|uniref:hypothetical protein n=1 Tax=Methanoregula sp. TaxID=2052170 RepID=UPI003C4DFC09